MAQLGQRVGAAFDELLEGLAFPHVADRRGQRGEADPGLDHAQPELAGHEHDGVGSRVRQDDELLLGVLDLSILLLLAVQAVPDHQGPHGVGRQEHPVLAAVEAPLGGRDLDGHAATVGVGIGADEDVHVLELPMVLLLGQLAFECLDGGAGSAGIARIGLLLAARIATERREQPVKVVQAALGDDLHVGVLESHVAQ